MTPRQIRTAGLVLLITGVVAGATIYFRTPADDSPAILGIDIRTNRQRNQLERMGGTSYVLMSDFSDWFDSLWRGRRLGGTIGVLSVIGFLACRGLARVHEDYLRELSQGAAPGSEGSIASPKQPSTSEDS
jgi:hypothetical protein